jgi:glycosyltransferase involved in cell wall biosynthesis
MDKNPQVAILLSTYNGDKYLAEQLDSILNQSYKNFIVVIRDDGSSDSTMQQLLQYESNYPNYFHVLKKNEKNMGASASFSYLVDYVLHNKDQAGLASPYMMFCDQDDVWLENKIETALSVMQKHEKGRNNIPILIHSDLSVVSASGEEIAESFIRYQGLKVNRNRFSQLVLINLVTGCAAMINRALAEKSLPVHQDAIMHDWWFALIASAFGEIVFIDKPLIHYRQHGSNTIGAKKQSRSTPFSGRFISKLFRASPNKHLQDVAIQANAFSKTYTSSLNKKQKRTLKLAGRLNTSSVMLQRVLCRILQIY